MSGFSSRTPCPANLFEPFFCLFRHRMHPPAGCVPTVRAARRPAAAIPRRKKKPPCNRREVGDKGLWPSGYFRWVSIPIRNRRRTSRWRCMHPCNLRMRLLSMILRYCTSFSDLVLSVVNSLSELLLPPFLHLGWILLGIW